MKFNRRSLLRGLASGTGVSLLTSMSRKLVREAHGATPQVRLLMVSAGTGWSPNGIWKGTGTDFSLEGKFAPLAPFKSKVLPIRELKTNWKKLHTGGFAITSQVYTGPVKDGEPDSDLFKVPSGVTFDRAMAQKLKANYPVSSLVMSYNEHSLSGDGPNQAIKGEADPAKLFERLFASLAVPDAGGGPPPVDVRKVRRKALLERSIDQTKALKTMLAASERVKLDQYLEGLAEIERRVSTVAPPLSGTCTPGNAPPAFAGIKGDNIMTLDRPEVVEAWFRLTAQAFICGATPVAHICIGSGGNSTNLNLPFLGVSSSHTKAQHDGQGDVIDKIEAWHFRMIGDLMKTLDAVPEGNGTALDHTIIMYFNEGGTKHHGGADKQPVLLAGGAGGKLKMGKQLEIPAGTRHFADLFVTISQAMGAGMETFGAAGVNKGPLPILA